MKISLMSRVIIPAHGTNWLRKCQVIARTSNESLELGEVIEKASQAIENAAEYPFRVLSGCRHYLFADCQFVLLSCAEGVTKCLSHASSPLHQLKGTECPECTGSP